MNLCTTGACLCTRVMAPASCGDLCTHRLGLCSFPLAPWSRALSSWILGCHWCSPASMSLGVALQQAPAPSSPLPCPVLVPRAGGEGATAAHRSLLLHPS